MKFWLYLPESWRHGREFIHAGKYRVPEDMSEETAALAVQHANAETEEPAPPPPKPLTTASLPASARKGKARRRPANKALPAAPENKSEG